jgi:ParB family chromosome partitioning protein
MKTKKSALGRGLSAILESPETDITSKDISGNYVVGAIANIPLSHIEANPFQPRNIIEQDSLIELSLSIKSQGIIQPVTVRKIGYDRYQLISGERRFRASQMAGLEDIPAFIRIANDHQMLEMALIENIHRKDLNPLDVAISYQRLIEECQITHEILSDRIGKDRTTITNYIRLLKLPPEIQMALKEEKISMGHARAIINISDAGQQLKILNEIIEKSLSVREVEKTVKNLNSNEKHNTAKTQHSLPEKLNLVRSHLSEKLNLKVEIRKGNKDSGSIVIQFKSEAEFEKIVTLLDN